LQNSQLNADLNEHQLSAASSLQRRDFDIRRLDDLANNLRSQLSQSDAGNDQISGVVSTSLPVQIFYSINNVIISYDIMILSLTWI